MIIHSAKQILTVAGAPQRGSVLGTTGLIKDGAIVFSDGIIRAVGKSSDLLDKYPDEERFDASGFVIVPGLVDPHTHAVWAGDRSLEFEMRIQGKTYLEIMEAGGGIVATVRATRNASLEALIEETRPRLRRMFSNGTTTAEVKSGYGLAWDAELRMMQAMLVLDDEEPIELVFTFLGAHAIPQEYRHDSDGYTALVCNEMLPKLRAWWMENASGRRLPFVDVFCETGAFNISQSKKILETARGLGFPLKIHADEFDNLGGASLAVSLGAVSADHLVVTSPSDIAALGHSETVAVSLPCTPFGLAEGEYTPSDALLNANAYLAIATDVNPGTAWCENLQFAISLACRYLHLTPAQALVSATINAAYAIRKHETVGSIEPGKQADFLLLDVPDYRHLGYRFGGNLVHTVVKKGKFYSNRGSNG